MLGWLRSKAERCSDPRRRLQETLGDFDLPSFSQVTHEALCRLRDPRTSLSDVGETIAQDPALSARVLTLSNSSALAKRHEVRSVHHAACLLGRAELESVVLAVAVREALPSPKINAFDPLRFWRSAARRATTARALANMLHPGSQSLSFTAALLADMAVPLVAAAHSARYEPVITQWNAEGGSLVRLERQALGFDHAFVAGWLAEVWKFPQLLTDAIGAHHDGGADAGLPEAINLVAPMGESDATDEMTRVVDEVSSRHGIAAQLVADTVQGAFDEAAELAARLA